MGLEKWIGPYTLLKIEKETYTIKLTNRPTDFWSTSMKPFYTSPEEEKNNKIKEKKKKIIFQKVPRSITPPVDQPIQQLHQKIKSNLKNKVMIIQDPP